MVEATGLEHHHPPALKVEYKGSQYGASWVHCRVPVRTPLVVPKRRLFWGYGLASVEPGLGN